MIYDLITYAIALLAFGFLTVVHIRTRSILSKSVAMIVELGVDKEMLLKKVSDLLDEKSSKELEKSEDFLKFVSQSRDWAFEYIENAQSTIESFVNNVDGAISSVNSKSPKSEYVQALEKINQAYKEVKALLPQDNK